MSVPFCCHTFIKDTIFVPWKTYCYICHQTVSFFSKVFKCTSCNCILHEPCYASMLHILHDINKLAEKTAQRIPPANDTPECGTSQIILKGVDAPIKPLKSTESNPFKKMPPIYVSVTPCSKSGEENSLCGILNHDQSQAGNQCNTSDREVCRCKKCIYCCDIKGVNKNGDKEDSSGCLPLLEISNLARSMPLFRVTPDSDSFSWERSRRARTPTPWRSYIGAFTSHYKTGNSKRHWYKERHATRLQFTKIQKNLKETSLLLSSSYSVQHQPQDEAFWIPNNEKNHIGERKAIENSPLNSAAADTDEVEVKYTDMEYAGSQAINSDSKERPHTFSRMASPIKWSNCKQTEDTHGMFTKSTLYIAAVKSECQSCKGRDDFHPAPPISAVDTPVEKFEVTSNAWGLNFSALQDGLGGSIKGIISGFLPSAVPFRSVSNSLTSASSRLVLASLSAASFVTSPYSFFDVQKLIRFYLDTSGRNSRGDPNVVKILESFFQLLIFFHENHPTLKSRIFNLQYLSEMGRRHLKQYELSIQDLPDASILNSCQVFAYGCDGVESNSDEKNYSTPVRAVDRDRGSLALGVPVAEVLPASFMKHNNNQRVPLLRTLPCEENVPPRVYYSVIQQIHDILRFAIAVYGAPYHTGSLSTMLGVAMTFTIQKLKVANLPKSVNDRAVTDILSLPPSALKLSRWSSRATEVSYAVLVEHLKRRIVLSFRGTMTDGDILTDICALGESFCGGLAHQGAARTVNALFNQRASIRRSKRTVVTPSHKDESHCRSCDKMETEVGIGDSLHGVGNGFFSEISNLNTTTTNHDNAESGPSAPQLEEADTSDDLVDTLERLAYTFPSYKIIITGHSLGGGVAVLFAIRLSYERIFLPDVLRRIHVISFAPMPTLTLPAAALFDEGQKYYSFPIWNIVNGCDIVPRLQINSLHRLLGDFCKGGDDSAGGPVPLSDATAAEMEEGESSNIPDKGRTEKDLTYEFYHPGRVFLMTSHCDPKKSRFVEVPRGHRSMHEVFLMKSMLNAHMIDSHMEGLTNIRSLSRSNTG